MYTLVSASVLALDLARHPNGAGLADVLDRALVLDVRGTGCSDPAVVDLERAAARERLLTAARHAPGMASALRAASASLGTAAGAVAAHLLRAALVGRLDDLVRLLTTSLDGAGHPREVADVVVDRAVAAWVQEDDTAYAADVARLTVPWDALVGEVPPLPPSSGDVPALLTLLEAVGRADRAAWDALDAAHTAQHTGLSWSQSMHAASRAAVEQDRTGPDRVVDVARWQLSAVRAIAAAGHGQDGRVPGAAMSVVGGVQALALHDVLEPQVADRLLAPCRSVLRLTG